MCKFTWRYTSFLHASQKFISSYVIDFLSFEVIIFSTIAINDRHPLWSCSIYQNSAILLGDTLYCTTGGGGEVYLLRTRKQNAHFILYNIMEQNFNFIGLQRSIGQQKWCDYKLKKKTGP